MKSRESEGGTPKRLLRHCFCHALATLLTHTHKSSTSRASGAIPDRQVDASYLSYPLGLGPLKFRLTLVTMLPSVVESLIMCISTAPGLGDGGILSSALSHACIPFWGRSKHPQQSTDRLRTGGPVLTRTLGTPSGWHVPRRFPCYAIGQKVRQRIQRRRDKPSFPLLTLKPPRWSTAGRTAVTLRPNAGPRLGEVFIEPNGRAIIGFGRVVGWSPRAVG